MADWHACLTRARSEKKVAERLERKGFTTYLPLTPRESQWKDRKKVVEWPVFPSYVFCRFDVQQMLPVLQTPGVADVVRHQGEPARIRAKELENVRRFIEGLVKSGQEAEPAEAPAFREGQPVRVVRGPFEGVRGAVREVRGRQRLLVGIEGIGQGLEVEVAAETLEDVA